MANLCYVTGMVVPTYYMKNKDNSFKWIPLVWIVELNCYVIYPDQTLTRGGPLPGIVNTAQSGDAACTSL